tara:strand:- start:1395 stop:1655 length:261 start_codon:yes stop_codon:yes gene_type:complete
MPGKSFTIMLESDTYSSYVTITPSMIIFDGYSGTTQIFELEIHDDAKPGVLGTDMGYKYIEITAHSMDGTQILRQEYIDITEAPSP